MFRISNNSVFEQPSGMDYVHEPRFHCSFNEISTKMADTL